ncbi:MAG: helix-turn-helix domain-containing protein [Muribaculaceae bacterium]|nr:helix-turn-helix domain-containing protein [Muribaculaceae bacterium]
MQHSSIHIATLKCFFIMVIIWMLTGVGCEQKDAVNPELTNDSIAHRQVMRVQDIYNLKLGAESLPEIEAIVDSMARQPRNPYYYAAVNVLIDRLFSLGHFSQADTLAVMMREDTQTAGDSVSLAMAVRVKAQMLYKLLQRQRAYDELKPASELITQPFKSGATFGTATSIQEWLWIIAKSLGDIITMNKAGLEFANLERKNREINHWTDSTGHYPVTALAFQAEEALTRGDIKRADRFLDSARQYIDPLLPARAYEHYYTVTSELARGKGDWDVALAAVDTLLAAHKDFPSFYIADLSMKADIQTASGKYPEAAATFSIVTQFQDSIWKDLLDRRLEDLTALYRTQLQREHKRTEEIELYAWCAISFVLLLLLLLSVGYALKEKKRVRILVERLSDLDQLAQTTTLNDDEENTEELSDIEKLDRHMRIHRPYTNAALGRKDLAEIAGMSQDVLGQLIRKEKGTSVNSYINSFRLEEARHVLGTDSDESIGELAVRLGFGTPRTLQRAFKERYDMSPTTYRKAARELSGPDYQ